MGWKDNFKVIGIVPGVVVLPRFGRIDLSRDDHSPDLIERIHKSGCPYLKQLKKSTKTTAVSPE